jgi:hypothetical protein
MPTVEEIDGALGALCRRALRSWWILEVGEVLIGLDCVRHYLPEQPKEDRDYVVSVRKYLETALGRMKSTQHRILLEVVLGLGDERWNNKEWRQHAAKERRAEAGRLFRESEDMVDESTIRRVYQPRATAELAQIIWSDEDTQRHDEPGGSNGTGRPMSTSP